MREPLGTLNELTPPGPDESDRSCARSKQYNQTAQQQGVSLSRLRTLQSWFLAVGVACALLKRKAAIKSGHSSY